MGQFGFTTTQALMHLSWKTCFEEHGKIITCYYKIIDWKQIEHGLPSDAWIMLMSAGTDAGSWACFCFYLQKHRKMQQNRHSNGMKATNIMHAKN